MCLISLGVIFLTYNFLLSAPNSSDKKKPFEITTGESGESIVKGLKEAGLIRSSLAFRIYAKTHGLSQHFGEGIYYLAPNMDAPTIAKSFLSGGQIDQKVVFIEGWRNEEYAKALNEKMGIDQQAFLKIAKQGYMFPDTYLFNKKETVGDIVGTLQDTFDKKVTDDIRSKFQKQKVTLDQAITLASIVERESHDSVPNERQIIASVLLKRLRLGMALQADATVQYALGYDPVQKKWWRVLSQVELQTKSPYNTYLQPGLTPGPICNPGLSSIEAVADATDTPYLYYIHGKDGTVHFAKTLEEHTANQRKYF